MGKYFTKLLSFFIFLIIFGSLTNCQKEEAATQEEEVNISEIFDESKLLKNPYEISTFRKAYQKVVDSLNTKKYKIGKQFKGADKDSSQIAPNYIYLKFTPINDSQKSNLINNENFTVRNYPLEYEALEDFQLANGNKISNFDSYWTSVPIDLDYPKSIPHEILQEMYLAEKDPQYNNDKSGKQTVKGQIEDEIDFMNHVLQVAYEATDNENLLPEPLLEKATDCKTCILGINLRSRWYPSGKIQIFDIDAASTSRIVGYEDAVTSDYSTCADNDPYTPCPSYITYRRPIYAQENGRLIPIEGVEVVIRDTWTLDRTRTNYSGSFRHKRVRAKVRYVIRWNNSDFNVNDGTTVFQAEDKSTEKMHDKPWNLEIRSGRLQYRGQIYTAAHWFYKSNISSLSRPPSPSEATGGKIDIAALNKAGSSYHFPEAKEILKLTSDIGIARLGRPTEDIFGTVVHELGHALHWKLYNSDYNFLVNRGWIQPVFAGRTYNPTANEAGARRVLETWATGVEIYVSNLRYRRYEGSSYNYRGNSDNTAVGIREGQYQNETMTANGNFYTSVVHDLFDSFNQRVDYGSLSNNLPNDNVSGINISVVQRALGGARTWDGFRDTIISESGATGTQATEITNLFNNW